MASSYSSSSSSAAAIALFTIFLSLLVQNITSAEDPLSLLDDVCKEVKCGKGICKPSINSTFFFECECDPGWKQTSSHHKFLPCIIPNCTLDYSCSKAASPAPVEGTESIFDACHWTYCGGGSCNKTSKFGYSCDCAEGYYNILNITTFPCFKDCALGMDCSTLGIALSNKSATPAPLAASDGNQASSTLEGNLPWLTTILMLPLSMLL